MTPDDAKKVINVAEGLMVKAIDHLENELRTIRAGRANPSMLSALMVDYYGTMTP